MTFQYNILRELTDAERELLTEQFAAFGAALQAAPSLPSPDSTNRQRQLR